MTQNSIPRPEYPRPQFVRENWLNLNGAWQFEIDAGDSGIHRGLKDKKLSGEILVPFCPESKLSGVEYVDFMPAVWYRREVKIPAAWKKYPRLRLHFQACDYETTVWVNGSEVARHRGGFTPFFAEIGHLVKPGGKAQIVVRARDDNRIAKASGKQSNSYGNAGCHYHDNGYMNCLAGAMGLTWAKPPLGLGVFFPCKIPPKLLSNRQAGDCTRTSKGERTSVATTLIFSLCSDLPIHEKRLKL